MSIYKDKKITVIGAGISGKGVAKALNTVGAKVILNDYKEIERNDSIRELEQAGVEIIGGEQGENLLEGIDLIVLSPGIHLDIPILNKARELHIPIVGEVEVAYHITKAPILGVTGTNGKTTTTMLLGSLINEWERPVVVGGNIGDSLSEQALKTVDDGYLVAELSSYQLETIEQFKPKGAILTNITPDHLQRHKTMEAYAAAKARIFENQDENDFAVLNKDDDRVMALVPQIKAKKLYFSMIGPVSDGAFYSDGILYAVNNSVYEEIIRPREIKLRGAHNIENILAVIALGYAMGIDKETLYTTIKNFGSVEHRIEYVATVDKVAYYNDSKATNTDSVIKALESFHEQLIVIVGGYDKGENLKTFMAILKDRAKRVVFLGKAGPRFAEEAAKVGINTDIMVNTMEEAIVEARKVSKPGDVILLSPACSSFDSYKCFEERGDHFKEIVRLYEEGGK